MGAWVKRGMGELDFRTGERSARRRAWGRLGRALGLLVENWDEK